MTNGSTAAQQIGAATTAATGPASSDDPSLGPHIVLSYD